MITGKSINIAIGRDTDLWHERFTVALDKKIKEGHDIKYQVVNAEANDWLSAISAHDAFVWKSSYMGPAATAQLQSKIYYLESCLDKLTIPNFSTIWHFENKIAQSYIFSKYNIPTPKTSVTRYYDEAIKLLSNETFPLVFKEPFGASSENIRLIADLNTAKRKVTNVFYQQVWDIEKSKCGSIFMSVFFNFWKAWFLLKLWKKVSREDIFRFAYWQEFIPNNAADLRITVIGDRYAFGFWRNNRPNDFRASGSGRIDYKREIPENVMRYCIKVNQELNFDSMAYDILFSKDGFVITEISYAYRDLAVYNAPGYYKLNVDGHMEFIEGHCWPQELWIEWAIKRVNDRLRKGDNKR